MCVQGVEYVSFMKLLEVHLSCHTRKGSLQWKFFWYPANRKYLRGFSPPVHYYSVEHQLGGAAHISFWPMCRGQERKIMKIVTET